MTAASDISWSGPPGTFNLRVAAVITRGDHILLCTVDGLGYWFLPGGRVRFGEPSDAALTRELAEELGHALPGGTLALVVENIFRDRSLEHEIGLYYRLTWPAELAPERPARRHRGRPPLPAGCRPASSARSISGPPG